MDTPEDPVTPLQATKFLDELARNAVESPAFGVAISSDRHFAVLRRPKRRPDLGFVFDDGYRFRKDLTYDDLLIIPGSLGNLKSPDEREPDAHKWLIEQVENMDDGLGIGFMELRDEYIHRYGFVIPTALAIQGIKMLAKYGVIDFGAGNGYLAYVLQQNGVKTFALDKHPTESGDNFYWQRRRFGTAPMPKELQRQWTDVYRADAQHVSLFDRRMALLISWPPQSSEMDYDALKAFRGDRLFYIGEYPGEGCTGSEKFAREVQANWDHVGNIPIVRFFTMHDYLRFYVRKR